MRLYRALNCGCMQVLTAAGKCSIVYGDQEPCKQASHACKQATCPLTDPVKIKQALNRTVPTVIAEQVQPKRTTVEQPLPCALGLASGQRG